MFGAIGGAIGGAFKGAIDGFTGGGGGGGGSNFEGILRETQAINDRAVANTLKVTNETTETKAEVDGARGGRVL